MARAQRILLIGTGGLGSPAALVLARAGIGTLALIDDDYVSVENLHRQILHRTWEIGHPKVESAARAIARIAPRLQVIALKERFFPERARELVRQFDVVLDGADNFATKFLVNDACVIEGIPFVHAGAIRWSGQLLPVRPGAPCYRCLFEEQPPQTAGTSCREAGVVGPVVGVIGALQAEAALALLDATPETTTDESILTIYDGLTGRLRQVRFQKNPFCRVCVSGTLLPTEAYPVAAC